VHTVVVNVSIVEALYSTPKLTSIPASAPLDVLAIIRYRAIIDNIRRYMPDASISGDAIVGFPGALACASSACV